MMMTMEDDCWSWGREVVMESVMGVWSPSCWRVVVGPKLF